MANHTFETKNKALFSWWASFYDSKLNRMIGFESTYRKVVAVVRDEIEGRKDQRNMRVLDVACGTGEILFRLAQEYPIHSFVGTDITPAMLERARQKTRELSNIEFQQGSATELPVADADFDIIICSDAFHHFEQPLAALREMYRVLRPGGMLILVDPAQDSVVERLLFNRWVMRLEHAHKYYTRRELADSAAYGGFSVESVTHHYYNTHLIARKP